MKNRDVDPGEVYGWPEKGPNRRPEQAHQGGGAEGAAGGTV